MRAISFMLRTKTWPFAIAGDDQATSSNTSTPASSSTLGSVQVFVHFSQAAWFQEQRDSAEARQVLAQVQPLGALDRALAFGDHG